MLILFQKERCPFCVKVRNYLSENNVSFMSVSSETGSPSRAIVEKLADGQGMVPFLIDTESGVWMHESDDIITYISDNYIRTNA